MPTHNSSAQLAAAPLVQKTYFNPASTYGLQMRPRAGLGAHVAITAVFRTGERQTIVLPCSCPTLHLYSSETGDTIAGSSSRSWPSSVCQPAGQ